MHSDGGKTTKEKHTIMVTLLRLGYKFNLPIIRGDAFKTGVAPVFLQICQIALKNGVLIKLYFALAPSL